MGVRGFSSSCLTSEQRTALAAVGIDPEGIEDTSCTAPSLNTCERDANSAIDFYGLYDPQKGEFSTWGTIFFKWGESPEGKDSRWGYAAYINPFSYEVGDFAARVESDGYRVVVYRALENIPAFPGLFDSSQWEVYCTVETTTPIGTLPYGELLSAYGYFDDEEVYGPGDRVLVDGTCGNLTYLFESQVPDNSSIPDVNSSSWIRLSITPNKKPNTCEKPPVNCDRYYGRVPVSLSDGVNDVVCVPVESTIGLTSPEYVTD